MRGPAPPPSLAFDPSPQPSPTRGEGAFSFCLTQTPGAYRSEHKRGCGSVFLIFSERTRQRAEISPRSARQCAKGLLAKRDCLSRPAAHGSAQKIFKKERWLSTVILSKRKICFTTWIRDSYLAPSLGLDPPGLLAHARSSIFAVLQKLSVAALPQNAR